MSHHDEFTPGDEPRFHTNVRPDLVSRAIREQGEDLATARASTLWLAAVAFLQAYLTPVVRRQIREAIPTRDWPAAYHMVWGMTIRNVLRKQGFGEREFGILNLDNIYVAIVEEAVAEPCEHPEFEAIVDVYRGPESQHNETLSRFEATIKIQCQRCHRVMVFRDFNGVPAIRVRLDPAKE